MEDPQIAAREMVGELAHPQLGPIRSLGNPIKLSDSPADVKRSPLLGEHTDEVLRDVLGMDEATIEAAKAEGAV